MKQAALVHYRGVFTKPLPCAGCGGEQAGLQRLHGLEEGLVWSDLIMSFGSFHHHILSPPTSQVKAGAGGGKL